MATLTKAQQGTVLRPRTFPLSQENMAGFLKSLREHHCVSEPEMAQKLGISLHKLRRLESAHQNNVKLSILRKYASIFDLDLNLTAAPNPV